MRPVRWCAAVLGAALVGLGASGCRDEQAGPRGVQGSPPPPPQAPAVEVPQTPAAPPSTQGTQGAQAAPPAPPQGAVNRGTVLDAEPAQLTFKSGATWNGGAVQYLGTRLEPERPRAGQPLKISHYFKALKDQPRGYQFFLHLVEPQNLQMLANLDHELQGGGMPLGSWPQGKVVEDVHGIMIPPGFSGNLRLLMGFWRGDDRLPVDDARAHDGNNRMLGPVIEVSAEGAAPAPEISAPPGASAAPPAAAPPAATASPAPPSQPAADLPAYAVKRAKKAPQIDGDLSDPAWADAAPVDLVGSYDGRRPQVRTTARLLYDDQALYVSFDCEDPHIWGTLFKRDDAIYTQEAVEIFIDADGDGATYNELEVSPNNTLFDAYFPARRTGMDLSWDSATRSEVKFKGTINNPSDRDTGWTVEMAIPYAKLAKVPRAPPKKGDAWRFNLYRLDGEQGRQEGMAFSPLFVGDFHHLPRFGRLNFD